MLKAVKKYGVVFGILIIIYIISLVLSFCIPNSWLIHNYEMSIGEFDHGLYWNIDNFLEGTAMDGQTDNLILANCVKQEGQSVLYNAMDVNSYPRYWHGNLVLLRPLLCVFKYKYIKYMSMILCFVLLCIAYQKICEVFNKGVGIAMVVSFAMGNIICIPLLLQYMSMYYITILSIIVFCMLYQKNRNFQTGLFFMIVGSITNFFDFLTTPLISLGFPLVLAMIAYAKREEKRIWQIICYGLHKSFVWIIGYGGTWLAKWCISSVILKKNVITDALEAILFRTQGSTEMPASRFDALQKNLDVMFPQASIVVILVMLLVWLFYMKRGHRSIDQIKKMIPVLLIALYPFVWYMVLSNHSQIHSYFTYRTLEITIFAVFAFLFMCVKWEKTGE